MAAVGYVTGTANGTRAICLMTAQTANVAVPTDEADSKAGVPCYDPGKLGDSAQGAFWPGLNPTKKSTLLINTSAGSGTMVGTFTLWGYKAVTGVWYPIPVNPTAGASTALAETAADKIRYRELFENLGDFDRLYLSLASIGGTDTAFEAWLVTGDESF